MTDLTLQQQCVLEVSGELPPRRVKQLHEAVAAYPAALLEYELVRGQFALLRTLPKVELSPAQETAIAAGIKAGIFRAHEAERRAARQAARWRFSYRALAWISASAAAVVMTGSLWLIQQNVARQQRLAVANATQSLSDYLQTNPAAAGADPDVRGVDSAITTLASDMAPSSQTPDDGMAQLIEALSAVPKSQPIPGM